MADKITRKARDMGQHIDEATILRIARKVVQPELVVNLDTKKVHSTIGCCFRSSPLLWTTKRGWKWVNADCPVKYISDRDGLPSEVSYCDKCHASLPEWAR